MFLHHKEGHRSQTSRQSHSKPYYIPLLEKALVMFGSLYLLGSHLCGPVNGLFLECSVGSWLSPFLANSLTTKLAALMNKWLVVSSIRYMGLKTRIL
jgi:hypothetical protein